MLSLEARIRQSTDLCVVWVGASQLKAGQAGTVALMCYKMW